jgi:hypothetical protein
MSYILRRTAVLKINFKKKIFGNKYTSLSVKFTDLLVKPLVLGGKLCFQVFRAVNLGFEP